MMAIEGNAIEISVDRNTRRIIARGSRKRASTVAT
jgi:hypothetical protein